MIPPRIRIPQSVADSFDNLQERICSSLPPDGPGAGRIREEVRSALTADLGASGPFDLATSRRLAAKPTGKAAHTECYWNAARAILLEPELQGAVYVEGLVSHVHHFGRSAPGRSSRPRVNVEWQGWVELGGHVIDPTARWRELPLTLTDAEVMDRTASATSVVFAAYARAIGHAREETRRMSTNGPAAAIRIREAGGLMGAARRALNV